MRVTLAADTITRDDLVALSEWVLTGSRLTKGPETAAFEQEFADRIGSRHAVFVNSGSSANLLMVSALKESGRLRNLTAIVPAISWATTVSPFLQLGYETILCDADPETLGVDVEHLEELIARHNPSVLALVHVLGHANRMDQIRALCDARDVFILEDACEALGSAGPRGEALGTFGIAGSFSLYYGHHLSTIEGGVIVTDDDGLFELLVAMRSHGWARDLEPQARKRLSERYSIDEFRELYTFYFPGYNLRATDLQAFIGRRQLRGLDEVVAARKRIDDRYRTKLGGFYAQTSETSRLSPFAFGTVVQSPATVAAELTEHGIESRPLICGNIARHPFWLDRFGPIELPIADQVHFHGMYLPIHAGMTESDVDLVTSIFLTVAEPYELKQ